MTPADLPLRPVGRSGLRVSAVGLGCNNFGRAGTATETLEGTRAVLDAAIEAVVDGDGAVLLSPQEFPFGRVAVVRDPFGAAFGLHGPAAETATG